MAVLYLMEQGSALKKEGERLVVEKDGLKLLDVPLIKIDTILIYGNVQVTTQAMSLLFEHGIETAFLTVMGELKGQLTPRKSRNIILRVAQFQRATDEEYALRVAQAVVKTKIQNQLYLMKQFVYKYPTADFTSAFRLMDDALDSVARKTKVANLLGVEGSSTAAYFKCLREMFRSEIGFGGRNRRPPQDEANALLSFGYVLVMNELTSLLEAVGFDPYIGFLHSIDYGRPSLSLDLLEGFRQPIVDRLVLTVCNKRILGKGDFEARDGGIYLKKDGMKTFFTAYEEWMNRERKTGGSFRDLMREQAQSLSKAIRSGQVYAPYSPEV
jgi:CRISPR-associated protein Cas1